MTAHMRAGVLTAIMVAANGDIPAAAFAQARALTDAVALVRAGETVEVGLADGRTLAGVMERTSVPGLDLRVRDRVVHVSPAEVIEINVVGDGVTDGLAVGTAIGGAGGLAMGVIRYLVRGSESDDQAAVRRNFFPTVVRGLLAGAGAGLLLDAVVVGRRVIFRRDGVHAAILPAFEDGRASIAVRIDF